MSCSIMFMPTGVFEGVPQLQHMGKGIVLRGCCSDLVLLLVLVLLLLVVVVRGRRSSSIRCCGASFCPSRRVLSDAGAEARVEQGLSRTGCARGSRIHLFSMLATLVSPAVDFAGGALLPLIEI